MSRQSYFEHDNRGPGTSRYRGGPAHMGRQRKYRDAPRGGGGKSRLLDFDGDVDMMAQHTSEYDKRRFNPYGGHNNRKKHNKRQGGKNKRVESETSSWYRITIPHGRKSGKAFILREISALCQVPFIAVNFQFNGNAAEFYVNSQATAYRLKDVHRKITLPDGFKMAIHVTKCSTPSATLNGESTKIIEECMSSHYDSITHILNLTKFHHDGRLKAAGLYTPLCKPVIIYAVTKIIKERIPEIEVLNLSDNKLYSLEGLNPLVDTCKQLKTLILKNNKIRNVTELNHVKGLDIIELILDGNPLCDDFKDKTSYISAVRDRFPKLLHLDGHELPPPIVFDLGPETFPMSKKSFFADNEGSTYKDLVIQFLDQYYTIYDSGDRSRLVDAYHDQANFSLSFSKQHSAKNSGGSLSMYARDNRNFLKVSDFPERFRLLKQGKLDIVSTLTDMPQTMHDPTSFSVDIYHISPALMSFSVIGVFKEVGAEINNARLKTFSRTFVVAPQGIGFVIINETLFLGNASQEQQAKAFKVPAPTPSPSPAPSNEEKSPAEKQQMVVELAKQTGMNLDFSGKCLEENDWDYQRAVAIFMKFQSEGKLPPEAFISH